MLGQDVLPADVLPATATLNRVTYSEEPYVQVEYKDGRSERVDIDQLENYVTKLTMESEEVAETVKEATVYYETDFCRNNVDIIDTPGLNDDEQMTNVTLSILPQIDAAVFVISANSPFSQFEKDFLEKKMLTSILAGGREQDRRDRPHPYHQIRHGQGQDGNGRGLPRVRRI